MSNIDDFNKAVAVILDKLYTTFPRRISLEDNSFDRDLDEEALLLYRDTLHFLAREGFIRYEAWSSGGLIHFEGVTLTMKGLDILTTTPDSLGERKTLGERIGGVLREGGGEALRILVQQIISMATGQG